MKIKTYIAVVLSVFCILFSASAQTEQPHQTFFNSVTSLGLEYLVYKQFSFDSETRFAGLTGNVKSQQIGVGYNVDVHDVRLTGFAAGGYDFETDKAYPVIGLRAKKLLTEHTFSFIEFVVPIEKQARPRLGFGLGFVF